MSAEPATPFATESATLDDLIARLRDVLARYPQVRFAFLFGSAASGKTRSDSDVDVAASWEDGLDQLGLMWELTQAAGREVDVVRLDALEKIPLLDSIVRTSKLLYTGDARALGDWYTRTLLLLEYARPWYARMRDAYLNRLAEGRGWST